MTGMAERLSLPAAIPVPPLLFLLMEAWSILVPSADSPSSVANEKTLHSVRQRLRI
jgi:hypothetical protein